MMFVQSLHGLSPNRAEDTDRKHIQQAVLTILIVLIPMLLNAHAGAKYCISFPSSPAPP